MLRSVLTGILAVASVGVAHADVSYSSGFANPVGLSLVGNATTAATGDGTVLRVASAAGYEAGAATTVQTLGAAGAFSTQFQFRLSGAGGIAPADGFAFVLAGAGSGTLGTPGSAGGGLGYLGDPNSVAVVFDTFNNGAPDDPNSNHVGIDVDGSLINVAGATPYGQANCATNTAGVAGCLSNGDLWTADISYNGTGLTVSVEDGSSPAQTLLTNFPINLAADLGTLNASVGFTGGTGAGYQNEDIVNWTFASAAAPTVVPEPASLMLLGAGMVGLGLVRRRRVS